MRARSGRSDIDQMARRADSQHRRLLLLLVLISAVVLLGIRYWPGAGGEPPGSDGTVAETTRGTNPDSQVTFDLANDAVPSADGQGTAELMAQGPGRSGAGNSTYVRVYECRVNGHRVVSDHPCGEDAHARVLEIQDADPTAVARLQQQPQVAAGVANAAAAAPTVRRISPPNVPDNTSQCDAIDRAIDGLNARMRQPYTSAEGEYLRRQWHSYKDQRYELGCGR